MKKVGRVGAYDQASGKGIILIKGSTEKVEFSIVEWKDSETLPSFGMFVEITDEGIGVINKEITDETLDDEAKKEVFEDKKIDIKPETEEFTFTKLRNKIAESFIFVHSDFKIISDKVNVFFIKDKKGGYVELKEDENGVVDLNFYNSGLSKSFIEHFKKYNINIKNSENGEVEILNKYDQDSVVVKNINSNNQNRSLPDTNSNENQALGIIAFVFSILGIFTVPIIMQPIALIMGIISKNIFGKVAAIIAGIHLIFIILSVVFGITLIMSDI